VSTTTSFFTAFRKAMIAKQKELEKGETRRIRIACIDFNQVEKNSFFSADCIKKLKSRGILRNMRYKGTAEFLTWGEVKPAEKPLILRKHLANYNRFPHLQFSATSHLILFCNSQRRTR
jgi:hypothetical protein